MGARMVQVRPTEICPDCPAKLYITRIQKRRWCKVCREFKD